MRSLVLTLVFALLFSSCDFVFNGIKGNGKIVEKQMEITDFNSIKVGGGFNVYLERSSAPGVRVEADENLMEHIRIYNRGETLIIDSRKNFYNYRSLKVYVSYVNIEAVDISGGVNLYASGNIEADDFSLEMSGGSDADIEIVATKLVVDMRGGVDLDLKYTGAEMDLSGSGGTDCRLSLFDLDRSTFSLSGGCDASVIGHANYTEISCTGGSDFNARGFEAQKANVSASGAADVHLKVVEELSVSASGASSVSILGNAQVIHKNVDKSASFQMH